MSTTEQLIMEKVNDGILYISKLNKKTEQWTKHNYNTGGYLNWDWVRKKA